MQLNLATRRNPGVSLIMTVYNREQYLDWAIASVLVQTEPNCELVIWDDGSTDGSLSIIQNYAQRDARVRWFRGEHQG